MAVTQATDAHGARADAGEARTDRTDTDRTRTHSSEVTGGRAARRRAQEAQATGGRAARRRAAEDTETAAEQTQITGGRSARRRAAEATEIAKPTPISGGRAARRRTTENAAEQTRATGGRAARRQAAEAAERTEVAALPVIADDAEQTQAGALPVIDDQAEQTQLAARVVVDSRAEQTRATGAVETTSRIDPADDDPATEEISGLPIAEGDADGDAADIVPDPPTPIRRQRKRTARLAPLAVGAAVMLLAAAVTTFIQPPDDDQVAAAELSGAVVDSPPPDLNRLDDVPQPTPEPTPTPVPEPPAPPAPEPAPEPEPEPAPPAPPAKNEGTQAANVHGWKLVGGDEFDNGLDPIWGEYNGEGHGGNGRRSPDHVTVENGNMVIRGDSDGNTGGVAWRDGQRFGRWEIRAKFPAGDEQYHPVLILWPTAENWPTGGEVDFAETTSASDDVSFFLHYSSQNRQVFDKQQLDITQWHNYAVEWVDGRITGYIDGEKWFESTDDNTLPPGQMHLTIQLDYFPDGGDPKDSEMLVDFVRIYE